MEKLCWFFHHITKEDVIWNLPLVEEFFYTIYDELEQILLGAEAFFTYLIHQCSHMLGHCRVPMNVFFIPRVEARQLSTETDDRRLKEIL